MKKKFTKIIACALALGFSFSLAACNNKTYQENYQVKYNLGYGDATRTVTVPLGATAVNWKPSRDGYELVGWYTDSGCSNRYNFHDKIGDNVTLYAKWQAAETATVTFDLNYGGKGRSQTVSVKKGDTVDEMLAPEVERLGFVATGWYKDAACTQKWNFYTDRASADTTLYAGYRRDGTVKVDASDKPIFENVNVNVLIGEGAWDGHATLLWDLANKFNAEYKGKIKVSVNMGLESQDFTSLRIQRTSAKNGYEPEYYSISEIYDLAGIDYSIDDYYAVNDSYVDGRLSSIPFAAGVPYLVYNRSLMTKYTTQALSGKMPKTFADFSTVMQAAYNGEIASKPAFKSLLAGGANAFAEVPSMAAFVQNDADYVRGENGAYARNTWGADADERARAVTAMQNTFAMLGGKGANHGEVVANTVDEAAIIDTVQSGNALMGYICWPFTAIRKTATTANVGILPLSGLFSDGAAKDRIPVYTYGLAFYKAKGLSSTALAAAGVFADYLSKNSSGLADGGLYPLYKAATADDALKNSTVATAKALVDVGDPENFYTMVGVSDIGSIVRSTAAEAYIVPALKGDAMTTAQAEAFIDRLATRINGVRGE